MVTMLVILIFLQACQLILTLVIAVDFGAKIDKIMFVLRIPGNAIQRTIDERTKKGKD